MKLFLERKMSSNQELCDSGWGQLFKIPGIYIYTHFFLNTPCSWSKKPPSSRTEQIMFLLFCHQLILCLCYITCHTSFVRDRYFWDLQPAKFEHGWNPGNPFNLYSSLSYLCLTRFSSSSPEELPSLFICLGAGGGETNPKPWCTHAEGQTLKCTPGVSLNFMCDGRPLHGN